MENFKANEVVFNAWWTLETTLTTESNNLPAKLALPPQSSSCFIKNLVFFHYKNLMHESALSSVTSSNKFSFHTLTNSHLIQKVDYYYCILLSSWHSVTWISLNTVFMTRNIHNVLRFFMAYFLHIFLKMRNKVKKTLSSAYSV